MTGQWGEGKGLGGGVGGLIMLLFSLAVFFVCLFDVFFFFTY